MNKRHLTLISSLLFLCFSSCSSNNGQEKHIHTYSDEWSYNDKQHWRESTCEHNIILQRANHQFSNWIINVEPTTTSVGEKYQECEICHYQQFDTIPVKEDDTHNHTYSSIWSNNETHHWHQATCGHNVINNYEVHCFSNWIINFEPTTTSVGEKYQECEICHYRVKENIPKIDEEEIVSPIDSIQDMNILHAWNWKLNDIKSRLKRIKKAGYGAIQTSPMQPHLDKASGAQGVSQNNWWKLYQPLAFKVATDNENILGTKQELTSLCEEAKKEGIKIIVDVVCNHLAGTDNNYSNQVYKQYPLHDAGAFNDNSVQAVVQGHIGLPDLDTSNSELQNDVLNMMKEYISCGVSGFRFDAAKHIETPDDGEYASNFWPYVLNNTTQYASSLGYDEPYYYGEILGTCGKGRSYSSYTKYMSVVDSNNGSDVINAVVNKSTALLPRSYDSEQDPNKLVIWAESHDNYANTYEDTTRNIDVNLINKAYIIQASKKDAATLYYARPQNMGVNMCTIDDLGGWQYKEIKAINKFHERYVDKNEKQYTTNSIFVNERGSGDFMGATFVTLSEQNNVEITTKTLTDGQYIDLISKDEFTVLNKKITLKFTNGSCILIPKSAYVEEIEDENYISSLVLLDAPEDKSYVAWVWGNNLAGNWRSFQVDNDGIGIILNSGEQFTIVEFPFGTNANNANWNNMIRQTIDMSYSGDLEIIDFSNLIWK